MWNSLSMLSAIRRHPVAASEKHLHLRRPHLHGIGGVPTLDMGVPPGTSGGVSRAQLRGERHRQGLTALRVLLPVTHE